MTNNISIPSMPKVIDLRVTKTCNMSCPFCFGAQSSTRISFDRMLRFLAWAYEQGTRSVVITGGEPSLYPDISALLPALHSIGYQIVFMSNGLFWDNVVLRDSVLENTSWLALPLESSSALIHNSMRLGDGDHYHRIINLLSALKGMRCPPKLRISTVVTKVNYSSIMDIPQVLPILPNTWKLYQLCCPAPNSDFYKQNSISSSSFVDLLESIRMQYRDSPFTVSFTAETDRDGQYLFLDPDGCLRTIRNNRESSICSILSAPAAILRSVQDSVDLQRIEANFNSCFGSADPHPPSASDPGQEQRYNSKSYQKA